MQADLRGPPKIVRAPGHSFSDMAAQCVHIVNLASVRELERALGRPVDPLRFRANLYLEGIAPWTELRWLGKAICVGAARLAVLPARSVARRSMSIRRAGRATWRSPPSCSEHGGMPISASMPWSKPLAKSHPGRP